MGNREPRAPGCGVPSAARALLGARGSLFHVFFRTQSLSDLE